MKLSKPLILAALVAGSLFAGGVVLEAQNATNPPPAAPPTAPRGMRGANIDPLAAALKLDHATKAKVKTIIDAEYQKIRDLSADTTLTQQEKRAKRQAIQDATATQMKAVLTPDQFTQWQQMQGPQRQRRAAPAPAATNAPPAAPKS